MTVHLITSFENYIIYSNEFM